MPACPVGRATVHVSDSRSASTASTTMPHLRSRAAAAPVGRRRPDRLFSTRASRAGEPVDGRRQVVPDNAFESAEIASGCGILESYGSSRQAAKKRRASIDRGFRPLIQSAPEVPGRLCRRARLIAEPGGSRLGRSGTCASSGRPGGSPLGSRSAARFSLPPLPPRRAAAPASGSRLAGAPPAVAPASSITGHGIAPAARAAGPKASPPHHP